MPLYVFHYLVLHANLRPPDLPLHHPGTGVADDGVKVHAKDTNRGVILCPKVDEFLNQKLKVAHLRKVAPTELVLLYLSSEAALKDLAARPWSQMLPYHRNV